MLENSSILVRYCRPREITNCNKVSPATFVYRKKNEFRKKDETYISLYFLDVFKTNDNQNDSLRTLVDKIKRMEFKQNGGFLKFTKGNVMEKFPEVIIKQKPGGPKDNLHHVGLVLSQDSDYLLNFTDYINSVGKIIKVGDLLNS